MAPESPRIAELRRRVESDPSSIAFAQLAEEYRRAGQFDAAEQCCRTGLARHPAYLSARVTLGRTLIELNKLDEAELELEQVLKAAPDNLAAIRGLAEIHQRLGRLDSALEYYRRGLTLAQHDPELEEIVARLNRELAPAAPASTPRTEDGPTDFDKLLNSFGITGHSPPPGVEALLKDPPQLPLEGSQPPVASVATPGVDAAPIAADATRVDQNAVEPQPDWTLGPLPNIVGPTGVTESTPSVVPSIEPDILAELEAAFETRLASETSAFAREDTPASYGEAAAASEHEEAAASYGETASAFAHEDTSASDGDTSHEEIPPIVGDISSAREESTASDGETMATSAREESEVSYGEAGSVAEETPASFGEMLSGAPAAPDAPGAPADAATRDRLILEELEAWLDAIKR